MFFEKFKEFPDKVQNQLGKTIKALQSDRGDEYLSQEFINHLKSYILEQKTLAETPQLNGVSELRNMTLLKMVCSMMNLVDLSISFWGYALLTAAHILNKTPSKDIEKTPYETWKKLEAKSEKVFFVGYPKETKGYYFYNQNMDRPTTYKAATASADSEKWLIAMKSKMESVYDNQVRNLVVLPKGTIPIQCNKPIWILLAIASYFDYEIWQMDIKTTFLNSYLEKKVYMTQLEGFVDLRSSKKVCKLQRSHLWIKACIRSWNHCSDEAIKEFGFLRNSEEACVYKRLIGSNVVFLALYVDDILIIENKLESIKARLGKYFSMKDLEEAQYILGIRIYRNRSKRMA
ncbi:UNVERIFIED_CONTAM: Retrovirus-related Pol polyprotein from transposon RE1 [Sesamum radiatum]|uniref:Retrovirus-related Pol polyprotein from transposon RE1 n=1 Tax=Sesamum radiatum TaxID=300843 RepID=A0AAW2M195_SESRA